MSKIVTLDALKVYHENIQELILDAKLGKITMTSVDTLPETGTENVIYLVPNGEDSNNAKDEYVWVNNTWEKLGHKVDLSNYATKTDVSNLQEEIDALPESVLQQANLLLAQLRTELTNQMVGVNLVATKAENVLNYTIATTGYDDIPTFSTEQEYTVNDLVWYNDSLYRCTQIKLPGDWDDAAFTHTSLYEELRRLTDKDLFEHTIIVLNFNGTPSDSQYSEPTDDTLVDILTNMTVNVDNGKSVVARLVIDYKNSKALELTFERDDNYQVIPPVVDGYYTPNTKSYSANMTERVIILDYAAKVITDYSAIAHDGVGLFIVDVDGVAHDPEDWVFANRDRAEAILVKTQTLIDNNACFYFKINEFLAQPQICWWPQNVDFPMLAFRTTHATSGGLDFGASYGSRGIVYPEDAPLRTGRPSSLTDAIIYQALINCQQYIDTGGTSGYNLGTLNLRNVCAAAYCRYSSWTDKDTYTLRTYDPKDGGSERTGYLGTAGQWYELWLNRDKLNALWTKLTGSITNLSGYYWWTSTQCTAGHSLHLGSSGLSNDYRKNNSYVVVPFYDL